MNIEDPTTWAEGAAAFKSIFDGLRSAIGLLRDVRASGGDDTTQDRLVEEALGKASRAAEIAEAEIAKALGHELCKCRFPPVAMLTIGHFTDHSFHKTLPVYECPKCAYNTRQGYLYTRIEPTESDSG